MDWRLTDSALVLAFILMLHRESQIILVEST